LIARLLSTYRRYPCSRVAIHTISIVEALAMLGSWAEVRSYVHTWWILRDIQRTVPKIISSSSHPLDSLFLICLLPLTHSLSTYLGYFTSRPALKGYVREMNSLLQTCTQAEALVATSSNHPTLKNSPRKLSETACQQRSIPWGDFPSWLCARQHTQHAN